MGPADEEIIECLHCGASRSNRGLHLIACAAVDLKYNDATHGAEEIRMSTENVKRIHSHIT